MLEVVLVQPEIPQNTGTVGRLCLATASRLHLVGPLGFSLDDRYLKRAGLDYWSEVDLQTWESFDALVEAAPPQARFAYLSTKGHRPYWEHRFRHDDYLVFGSETRGLPDSLLRANEGSILTIPQRSVRSLNLATAVAVTLYEGVRQLSQNT